MIFFYDKYVCVVDVVGFFFFYVLYLDIFLFRIFYMDCFVMVRILFKYEVLYCNYIGVDYCKLKFLRSNFCNVLMLK